MVSYFKTLIFVLLLFTFSIVIISGAIGIRPEYFPTSLISLIIGISLLSGVVFKYRHVGTSLLFGMITIMSVAIFFESTIDQLVAVVLSAAFGVLHTRSKLWFLATLSLFFWMLISSNLLVSISCLLVHWFVSWVDKITYQVPVIGQPIRRLWSHRIAILIFCIAYAIIIGLFAVLYRFVDVMSDGSAIIFNEDTISVENMSQYIYLSSVAIVSGPPNEITSLSLEARFLIGVEIFFGVALIVIYLQEVLNQSKGA